MVICFIKNKTNYDVLDNFEEESKVYYEFMTLIKTLYNEKTSKNSNGYCGRARFCGFLNLRAAVFAELRLSLEGGTLHTFQDVDIVHGEADPFAAFATLIEMFSPFRLPSGL